jgi:hypothetical protein
MPLKIAALTAALLFASVTSSFGQAGRISGRVLDQTGSVFQPSPLSSSFKEPS